jgi:undecaprenyl-diphosphatase
MSPEQNTDTGPSPEPGAAGPAEPRALGTRLVLTLLVAVPALVVFGILAFAAKQSWGPLRRLDHGVADHLHTQAIHHPAWVTALKVATDVGSPTVVRIGIGVLAVTLWLRGFRRLALWAAATIIAGGILDVVLKAAIDRARPSFPDPVIVAPGASFPSGHAFTSFLGFGIAVLVVLPLVPRSWHPVVWAAGILATVIVGYTRIALGAHWVSDVVGGWLIGVGLLAATTAAFETWRREHGLRPVRPVTEGVPPSEDPDDGPGAGPDAGPDRGPDEGPGQPGRPAPPSDR